MRQNKPVPSIDLNSLLFLDELTFMPTQMKIIDSEREETKTVTFRFAQDTKEA